MGTHPIFESDFDCLTEMLRRVGPWFECLSRRGLKQIPGFANFLHDFAEKDRKAENIANALRLEDTETLRIKATQCAEYMAEIDQEAELGRLG